MSEFARPEGEYPAVPRDVHDRHVSQMAKVGRDNLIGYARRNLELSAQVVGQVTGGGTEAESIAKIIGSGKLGVEVYDALADQLLEAASQRAAENARHREMLDRLSAE